MLPTQSGNGKGVLVVEIIISFLVAVTAGVVIHYINKWLDNDDKGNK